MSREKNAGAGLPARDGAAILGVRGGWPVDGFGGVGRGRGPPNPGKRPNGAPRIRPRIPSPLMTWAVIRDRAYDKR